MSQIATVTLQKKRRMPGARAHPNGDQPINAKTDPVRAFTC